MSNMTTFVKCPQCEASSKQTPFISFPLMPEQIAELEFDPERSSHMRMTCTGCETQFLPWWTRPNGATGSSVFTLEDEQASVHELLKLKLWS